MGKLNQLLVAEVFFSLQGEGSTMGVPAVFLRLGGCNLLCDGAWRCDTIEVWKSGSRYSFGDVIPITYLDKLRRGAHLVITGGEPLLQSEALVQYLVWFTENFDFFPYIEIETNGTKKPLIGLVNMVDQWNVSPKLTSSGVPKAQAINTPILSYFNNLNSIFKFVISSGDDWLEISDLFLMTFVVDRNKVWLMPAASNIDQLLKMNGLVSKIALEKMVNFSTRLQVEIWDKTTGV